jgi:Fe-S cluster assembly protein SufD
MNNPAPYLEAFQRIDSPEWLAAARDAALARVLATDLPQTRQEDWRYTSLAHIERQSLHAPVARGEETVCVDVTTYPGHVLSFDDGRLSCHGTYLPSTVAGTMAHLGDTPAVREHLGHLAGDNMLSSLNLALWQDGAHLYVPADKQLSVPVFAVYTASEAETMLYPRTLAVLDDGAEAVLVEHFAGHTVWPYWQNTVCEIVLGENAHLTHVRLMEEGDAATHTGGTHVRVGRGAEYHALLVGLGGKLTRHDLTVTLAGEGAQAHVDALEWTPGRRHADLHLRVNHQARHTTSRITWRGIADQRGHAVFDGHVVVEHDAHGTDARQSCRGLLLSPQAEIDAMPRLEIYADDVKCGHGASIGNLDDAAMFYLRSRGIDVPAARALLLQGFAAESLGLMADPRLDGWLMPKVTGALHRRAGEETGS